MALLKRVLTLRASRETRDARSLRRARDARAQADEEVSRAARTLEQGLLDARLAGDALFDGLRGGVWPLSAVQGMHGQLEAMRQETEALRDDVADAEDRRQQRQAQLEAAQATHARSWKQLGKTREMNSLHEQDVRRHKERKEDLEMEEIGALRRSAA